MAEIWGPAAATLMTDSQLLCLQICVRSLQRAAEAEQEPGLEQQVADLTALVHQSQAECATLKRQLDRLIATQRQRAAPEQPPHEDAAYRVTAHVKACAAENAKLAPLVASLQLRMQEMQKALDLVRPNSPSQEYLPALWKPKAPTGS